jgi:hypothetical protein
MKKVVHANGEELLARLADAPPPTSDDVTVTTDGRRIDSKDAALEWLAELAAKREAGQDIGGVEFS